MCYVNRVIAVILGVWLSKEPFNVADGGRRRHRARRRRPGAERLVSWIDTSDFRQPVVR